MTRTLHLESVAGIAGDMFASAFLHAGLVQESDLTAVPGLLGLADAEVRIERVKRAGVEACSLQVLGGDKQAADATATTSADLGHHHHTSDHAHHHAHSGYGAIRGKFERSKLSDGARAFALDVYAELARVEAAAHGVSIDEVMFHEVGSVDSIVDVAMAGVCVEAARADRFVASPVPLGRGTIQIAHGSFPVPAPASARLAEGMRIRDVPAGITAENVELATPTGLAILRVLAPEWADGWPSGTLIAQGFGAGQRDLGSYPNVFRVALIECEEGATSLPYLADQVIEISCNVDDQTGEQTGWILDQAFDHGALDAWATPVTGKKGRPGVQMSFLAARGDFSRLSDWLLRESTTFGIRHRTWDRLTLDRHQEIRDGASGPVRYKVGKTTAGEILKEKPEFDDVRRQSQSEKP